MSEIKVRSKKVKKGEKGARKPEREAKIRTTTDVMVHGARVS
jgi:hypothetical protein